MKKTKWFHRSLAAMSAAAVGISAIVIVNADTQKKKQLLILGDSISAGYGLAEGEWGYYDYIAECTGAELTNYAVSGYETKDVLAQLQTAEIQNAVKNADVICMSIGSNDLLHPTLAFVENLKASPDEDMYDAMQRVLSDSDVRSLTSELTSTLRDPINQAKENIAELETQIRALNSDAELIMFTLYNPFETNRSLVYDGKDYSSSYQSFMDYVNGQEERISGVIRNLKTVETVDICTRFLGTGWLYLRDEINDIHPNEVGHALIAATALGAIDGEKTNSSEFVRALGSMPADERAALPALNRRLLLSYATMVGDLDSNKKWENADAEALMRYVTEMQDGQLSADAAELTDVNGDGSIDILDVTALLSIK